jgi:hypothetical protein
MKERRSMSNITKKIFTDTMGAHNCSIWSGLNGTSLEHNQQSAATGQFFYDINTANSAFPGSGLIT